MEQESVRGFYDSLAADYHLLYPDWDASISRQGRALDRLIRQFAGQGPLRVLDCACGIGTQALALAQRGHSVLGTDLSPLAAGRAKAEAKARDVQLPVAAADMRRLPFRAAAFDVVVCADNSISHLLSALDVQSALEQMHSVLKPGGLLLLTKRPDEVRERHPTSTPVQVTHTPAGRVISFQLWTWHRDGERYDMEHIQLHPQGDTWTTRVRRTTSWAMTTRQVEDFAVAAGFTEAAWHDPQRSGFFQPVLTATAQ